MGNKKKIKFKLSTSMVVMILIGIACGVSMNFIGNMAFGEENRIFAFFFQAIVIIAAYLLHLIIHEAGHLVAGLMSGYEFGSFRIGSIMFVKDEGKIKIKKNSVAGTGGQCLMHIPDSFGEDYPVIFYNLGGVLMNILVSLIFIVLAVVFSGYSFALSVFLMSALSGFIVAATNGIPLKLDLLNNDGSNARELYKNKEAKCAFYNQFKIIENASKGIRFRDMNENLFTMPSEEGLRDNSISASAAIFCENRLIDEGRFDEALELINKLLRGKNALVGLYKNLLVSDKITILLLKQEKLDIAKQYYDNAQYKAFAKQMATNISILRTDYAYMLLHKKDEDGAKKALEKFDAACKTHPYQPDIDSEREIIELIKAKYSKI